MSSSVALIAIGDFSHSGSFSGGISRESLHLLDDGAAGVIVNETGEPVMS